MDDIKRRARRIAQDIVASEKFSEMIANGLISELRKLAGGEPIYIAHKGDHADKLKRNAQIKSRFTGDNYVELGKEFNLNPRQIRRIIQNGM